MAGSVVDSVVAEGEASEEVGTVATEEDLEEEEELAIKAEVGLGEEEGPGEPLMATAVLHHLLMLLLDRAETEEAFPVGMADHPQAVARMDTDPHSELDLMPPRAVVDLETQDATGHMKTDHPTVQGEALVVMATEVIAVQGALLEAIGNR